MEDKSTTKWIIDTDYSYDDQLALAYLIDKLDILCITVVATNTGYTSVQIKDKIESDLKEIYKREDIEVFAGADIPYIDFTQDTDDLPLINPYNVLETPFNKNIVDIRTKDNIKEKLSKSATVKLIEKIREYKENLNILALGPLTNLSLSSVLDGYVSESGVSLYIAGGSILNYGNSGLPAEYRFRADPIAAKTVFSYYKNINLFPFEIEISVQEKVLNDIFKQSSTKAGHLTNLIRSASSVINEKNYKAYNFLSFYVAVLIVNNGLIKLKVSRPCDVETIGKFTKGVLMIEKYEHMKTSKLHEVNIVEEIHVDSFIATLKDLYVS